MYSLFYEPAMTATKIAPCGIIKVFFGPELNSLTHVPQKLNICGTSKLVALHTIV